MARVVIIGGGPGGYEAASAAAQLGAEVTVVDSDGIGGSGVLTDAVPSKTLIATAEVMTEVAEAGELGVRVKGDGVSGIADPANSVRVDLSVVNQRVKRLAAAQSDGITRRLDRDKVRIIQARGRLDGPETVIAGDERLDA
ncbi:FAD-dependent oxidoreductase, partial [Kribbella sp. NPDC050820]|uniref:FAD-dependent oxidoreductase n=1 Tax=Kribbella sp. NPDC050820 TaxID=3155408 RepID=UPI0033CB538E